MPPISNRPIPENYVAAAMREAAEGVARAMVRPKSQPVDLGCKEWAKDLAATRVAAPTGDNRNDASGD